MIYSRLCNIRGSPVCPCPRHEHCVEFAHLSSGRVVEIVRDLPEDSALTSPAAHPARAQEHPSQVVEIVDCLLSEGHFGC